MVRGQIGEVGVTGGVSRWHDINVTTLWCH
jgi:hypothetical protein